MRPEFLLQVFFPLLYRPLLQVVHGIEGLPVLLLLVVGWMLLVATPGSTLLVSSNATLRTKPWLISCSAFVSPTRYKSLLQC